MTAHAIPVAADFVSDFLYKPGLAGGQLAYGGTAPGDLLTLQGSSDADRGRILANGGITIDWDWSTDAVPAGGINTAKTIPSSGGYIGAFISIANNITVDSGLFILSAVDDLSILEWTVAPGFAVETLFFARQTFRSTTAAIAPAQSFIFAAQTQYRLTGVGAVTVANYRALSFAPIIRVDNAGDDLSITNTTGIIVSPLWNTRNATAVADFGNIRGVHMLNAAAVGFGGQSLGSEIASNWIGVDVESLTTLVVSGRRAAVRSAIPLATNARFLENLSTANSDFGASNIFFRDNTGVALGGAYNAADVLLNWQAAGYYRMFFTANSDDLRFSNAVNGQILINSHVNQMTLNSTAGMSFGAQTGTNGNQFFNFAQGAWTPPIAGDAVGVLLTQAGSFTNNGVARGRVSAWVINGFSYASSSGSVSEADTLTVGGMVTSAPGVTITTRQSLNVIGGRSRFSSTMMFPPITPAALGSGNVNNWAGLLTGSANNGMRHWARISGNATTSVLTGIDATAVQDGDTFELTNVSANAIDISHQDAASTAANRIITPSGVTYVLAADETVIVRYDATTARWRLLGGTGA